MKARKQQVSRAALKLVKRFEGYRRSAAQLADGRWTIGYGHTKTARAGAVVSEDDAEALLIYDMLEIAGALNDWIYTPLTQNQFDALAAFVFNIGVDNFRRSAVLRRLNEGSMLQAACAMEMWRKADFEGERILIDALVRRRAAEKVLFLTPQDGWVVAPTTVLPPKVDLDITGQVPARRPVEVTASLEGDRATAERAGPAVVPAPPTPDEEEPSASEVASAALSARLQSIFNEPEPAPPSVPQDTGLELELPSPPVDEAPQPAHEPELPAEAEPVAADVAPEPEAEAERETLTLTSPAVESAPLETFPAPSREEPYEASGPGLFAAEPMTFGDFESRRVSQYDFEASDLERAPEEPTPGIGAVPALIGLALLGLVVFAGGIFWASHARAGESGAMQMLGWGLGIVGIGCVALAVYFLLERLGGREEP